MLCNLVLTGLTEGLNQLSFSPGDKFDLILNNMPGALEYYDNLTEKEALELIEQRTEIYQ